MKTKLIILTAVVSALLYSCGSDRDENITPNPVSEKTSTKEFELNKNEQTSRSESDTIIVRGLNMPDEPEIDGGDPKDVPPRK